MLVMVVIGIPMYICATASTPVAASMILAGVSPGAAMVFMLAGPATNIATLGIVRKEMGNQAVFLYLTGVISSSLIAGYITDYIAKSLNIDMAVQLSGDNEIVPEWLAVTYLVVLIALALRFLLRKLLTFSTNLMGRSAEKA